MKSSTWMWAGVCAAFALLIAAWTFMFVVAHHAKVESVPLATAPAKAGEAR